MISLNAPNLSDKEVSTVKKTLKEVGCQEENI